MKSSSNLVWLDLEMTGLDVKTCKIIEIAVIITDKDLNVLAESDAIAIHQSKEIMDNMNDWCIKTHNESGLVRRVLSSDISTTSAEQLILNLIKKYVPFGKSPLCGNSIHQDKKFLAKYMPELESFFHYRLLDVSTLKIISKNWYPEIYNSVTKQNKHLALDDIRDSINELKHYKKHMFID